MKSWKNEYKEAIRKSDDLENLLGYRLPHIENYPLFIPQRIAQKLKNHQSLYTQYVPSHEENAPQGLKDPIGDQTYQVAPQLIHRYPSRALFLPTQTCPVYCRFCFRKNELGKEPDLFSSQFDKTLSYLKKHPEIKEIIFSGGDPFVLDNIKIKYYLNQFLELDTIKHIRFHTKFLTTIPSRFDEETKKLLLNFSKKFNTLSLSFHINSVDEFDEEVEKTVLSFSRSLNLIVQTVLLKGVNDSKEDLLALFEKCLDLGLRPYYLHHPDQVEGAMHFGISLEKGREIYSKLRSHLPGWAIPHYVLDIPGGHGKALAYNSESFHFSGKLIGHMGNNVDLEGQLH